MILFSRSKTQYGEAERIVENMQKTDERIRSCNAFKSIEEGSETNCIEDPKAAAQSAGRTTNTPTGNRVFQIEAAATRDEATPSNRSVVVGEEEACERDSRTPNLEEEDDKPFHPADISQSLSPDGSEYICSIIDEDGKETIGCVVRLSTYVSDTPFECELVNSLNVSSPFTQDHEKLLSNIIKLNVTNPEKEIPESLSVAMPYFSKELLDWQEPVFKQKSQDGSWKEAQSHRRSFKYGENERYIHTLEGEIECFQPMAIIARPREWHMVIDSEGGSVTTATETEVSVEVPPGNYSTKGELTLKIFFIDSCTLTDFRSRDRTSACLLGVSPVVHFKFRPEPANFFHVSVPWTQPVMKGNRFKNRFSTTHHRNQELDGYDFRLLKIGYNGARVHCTQCQERDSGDRLQFDWYEGSARVVVLKLMKGLSYHLVEKLGAELLAYVTLTPVVLTSSQCVQDLKKLHVSCAVRTAVLHARPRRQRADEAADERVTRKDLRIREGQRIQMKLRGNIRLTEKDMPKFAFHSTHPLNFWLNIQESDRYTQRSLDMFCGALQVLGFSIKEESAPQRRPSNQSARSGSSRSTGSTLSFAVERKTAYNLLVEIPITLPKPSHQPPVTITRATPSYDWQGSIDVDTLKMVASELGDEWTNLVSLLNISKARLQSILWKNGNDRSSVNFKLELLLTWILTIPRSKNKADILSWMLQKCGRHDLASIIHYQDQEYKQHMDSLIQVSNLKKAIAAICKSNYVVRNWENLATILGQSSKFVSEIDNRFEDNFDKCYHMLMHWSMEERENMVSELTKGLQMVKCPHAAEFLASTFGH